MKRLRIALLSASVAAVLACTLAPAGAATSPTYREYVALGDSYTSSTGFSMVPDQTIVPLGCAQSVSDYPHQVAALLKVPTFRDASCGGASTKHFTGPQSTQAGTNAPQFDRITPTTDLITIGIGGNDIGLVGLAQECLQSTATSCKSNHVKNGVDDVSAKIAATQPKIEGAILGARARAAKKARIILVNYLEAMPDNEKGCYPLVPVSPSDAEWFTQKYKEMNAMLARAAAATKAEVADTYGPTIGHNACTPPNVRYVEAAGVISLNPLVNIAAPLHPNQAGANAQSQLVFAHIAQG
ncbi:MAG TPA: SGNH/GDSL hydrolase family protein [Aeromicrobium sp.]|nr:SGNH/GDSL hydrolase family protein [Aeromicrobium sp.]